MRSIAIIALAAVIGLMAGCDNPANTSGGGGFVAVSYITNVPTSGTVGYLPLYGTVNPPNATNKTIAWSVVSGGTTGASISGSTLTTAAAGTVTVRATIANGLARGTNYTQDFTITISAGVTPSAITYTVTQDGGVDGETNSTGIVFTFNDDSVNSMDLTAADITVGGAAAKGDGATLSGEEIIRILSPITVNAAGLATVSINKPGIEAGTKTVTVYKAGEYAPQYWSINWELNGGTAGTGTYPAQIAKGAVLAKPSPDPTKADNTFGGWYMDSGLTQAYNFTNPVNTDLNLYAKWETVPVGPPTEITVTAGNTLAEKLQWVKNNAQSNTIYTVGVDADEGIAPQALSYTGKSAITVQLIGSGAEKVVSLSQDGSLFTVESGVTLVLDNNVTLQGRNYNTASLVRVNEGGELIMNIGAKITGNPSSPLSSSSSPSYGGGVHVNGGTFTMAGGEISGNSSRSSPHSYGGGVYVSSGTFTMNNGEISGNECWYSSYGDGVYVGSNGTFTMNGGEISGNTANSGGGVYVAGTFTMNDGKISSNYEGVYVSGTFTMAGGEISNNGNHGVYVAGTFTMAGGEISGNSSRSSSYGGGVYVGSNGTFTMSGGKISGNSSSYYGGGGVYVDGTFTMEDGTISDNTTTDSPSHSGGGGVYVGSNGTFTMAGGEISGNTSSFADGGGVNVGSNGTFTMSGGEISGNTSYSRYDYSYGGGVYVNGGTFTMEDGKISGNISSYDSSYGYGSYGGGVYVASGTFTMDDGEISGNTANSGGGVYVYWNGIFTKTGGTLYGYNSSDTINSNVVKNSSGVVQSNQGHAVYVDSEPAKRRETTAGPGVDLDSSQSGTAGGWEN